MPLRGLDASSRAAKDLLDPERGIAFFVADVANPTAIRRKARLGPIELTESQWQWRSTLHGRQPELLPLAAVITAEQDTLAIRCDLGLRPRRRVFAKELFQKFGGVLRHVTATSG